MGVLFFGFMFNLSGLEAKKYSKLVPQEKFNKWRIEENEEKKAEYAQEALTYFQELKKIESNASIVPYSSFKEGYIQQIQFKDLSKAEELYKKVIQSEKESLGLKLTAQYNLATIYLESKKNQEAWTLLLELFDQINEESEIYPKVVYNLIWLKGKSVDNEDIKMLQEIIDNAEDQSNRVMKKLRSLIDWIKEQKEN